MIITREMSSVVHFVLDELLPPVIRENRLFMGLLFRLFFGKNYAVFLNFKQNLLQCKSQTELSELYREINAMCIDRETDLNKKSLAAVLESLKGPDILEVGAGRLFLAKLMAKKFQVTATDVSFDQKFKVLMENISLLEAGVEQLPFQPKSFTTVVSTHTLEHVLDFDTALSTLRRLARERLVIVVPKQRFYRYTFDTHVHFFPTSTAFLMRARPTNPYSIEIFGNDIVYVETMA